MATQLWKTLRSCRVHRRGAPRSAAAPPHIYTPLSSLLAHGIGDPRRAWIRRASGIRAVRRPRERATVRAGGPVEAAPAETRARTGTVTGDTATALSGTRMRIIDHRPAPGRARHGSAGPGTDAPRDRHAGGGARMRRGANHIYNIYFYSRYELVLLDRYLPLLLRYLSRPDERRIGVRRPRGCALRGPGNSLMWRGAAVT